MVLVAAAAVAAVMLRMIEHNLKRLSEFVLRMLEEILCCQICCVMDLMILIDLNDIIVILERVFELNMKGIVRCIYFGAVDMPLDG